MVVTVVAMAVVMAEAAMVVVREVVRVGADWVVVMEVVDWEVVEVVVMEAAAMEVDWAAVMEVVGSAVVAKAVVWEEATVVVARVEVDWEVDWAEADWVEARVVRPRIPLARFQIRCTHERLYRLRSLPMNTNWSSLPYSSHTSEFPTRR